MAGFVIVINPLIPIFISLSLLATCLTTGCSGDRYVKKEIYNSLKNQAADVELTKISGKLLEDGEVLEYSTLVHFYLKRWENIQTQGGTDIASDCDNDLLIVTNKRVIVSENFYPISDDEYPFCSIASGNAVLRPPMIYSFEFGDIKNIEYFRNVFPSGATNAFSVNLKLPISNVDRIYIAVDIQNISSRQGIYKALFNEKNMSLVDARRKCDWRYSDKHYCGGPHLKEGPLYNCSSGSSPNFFSNKRIWRLYVKHGDEMPGFFSWSESSWFETPAQWVVPHFYPINNPCAEDIDLWSSDKSIAKNLLEANSNYVLYIGDERQNLDEKYATDCVTKYAGIYSVKEFKISNCEKQWYRVGGRQSGPCKGMDGVKVRRLTIGGDNCYLYEKVDSLKTIDEHYNRKQ